MPPIRSGDALNNIINSRGGLFWLVGEHPEDTIGLFKTLEARFGRHVEYAKKIFYTEKPRDIEFGFICEGELNVFAYTSPKEEEPPFDFIGINVGVIFTLLCIFNRILSHPKTFPEVGNSSLEHEERASLPHLTTNVYDSDIDNVSLRPKCKIRSYYASELTQTALDFLFFHELTHLKNGHVNYIISTFKSTELSESFSGIRHDDKLLIRQALEIDADCGAIQSTIGHAFRMKDLFKASTKKIEENQYEVINSLYGSAYNSILTVCYSVYIFFRIFDVPKWCSKDQPKSTHPFKGVHP